MEKFYNFDQYEIDRQQSFGGANGFKYALTIDGTQYMLKAPDPSKKYQGNDFFPYTEYMSCKILSSLGLNCQQTLLGEITLPIDIPEKVEAVACKNFRPNMEEFTPFYNLRNARFYGSSSSNSRSSELSEILATIDTQSYVDPFELKNFFWEQFVGDALIGNFDRHNGNWGLLKNFNRQISICPIFDCGSSLFCRIQDRYLLDIDNRQALLDSCCYDSCKSAIEFEGKKINYYQFLSENINADCTKALVKLIDRMDLNKITSIIENTPIKHEYYKQFCLDLIRARKELVIDQAYNHIKSPSILTSSEKLNDYDEFDCRTEDLLRPINPCAKEIHKEYQKRFQKAYSDLTASKKINNQKRLIDSRVDAGIIADLLSLKKFSLNDIKKVIIDCSPVYVIKEDDYVDKTINRAKQMISNSKQNSSIKHCGR